MHESDNATQAEEPEVTLQKTEKNWPPDKRLIFGMVALVLWLFLFAMGVLIPSGESRKILGWTKEMDQKLEVSKIQEAVNAKDQKTQQQLTELKNAIEDLPTTKNAPLINPAELISKANGVLKDDLNQKIDALSKEINLLKVAPEEPPSRTIAFLIATFSFMPLNVGFLCILAAFLGGCSVNKEEVFNLESEAYALPPGDARAKLARRLEYLKENPLYSAIRGLVVYLILISGLQIIGSAPVWEGLSDKDLLTNYIKLAGLFSFFGYLAGYDPTVFTSMINFGSSRLRGDSTTTKSTNVAPVIPTKP